MGTDKRERQKAGKQARLEAARIAQDKADQRAKIIRTVVIVAVVVAVTAALTWSKRNSDEVTASAPTTVAGETAPTTEAPSMAVPDGEKISGDTPCPPATGAEKRTSVFEKAPPMCIDPAKTHTAKMSTSRGDITIALDPKAAPKTVNNFVTLARYKYFDGTSFHRVATDFVIQGGDPKGNGTGNPGYKFEDELPKDGSAAYKKGTLAMANSSQPGTNGSQFFIVLADGKFPNPNYSVFGQVTEGLDTVVKEIGATGPATGDGPPTSPTVINSVTITES